MKNNKKSAQNKFNIEIILLAVLMAGFYGYMMFNNGPWYDELYTYYSFVSRGPVYAAIHWPVPNNHVGYSVISAVFNLFGNQYIGLRGVSFIAAVANLVLIYEFALKLLNKNINTYINRFWAFMASIIYVGAWIINNLSIQGRGYTLAITCLMVAITSLYRICIEGCRRRDYVVFGVALSLGLYILPSSVYWVIPVCLIGGFFLLCTKQTRVMLHLIITSIIAAIVVVGLYAIIWLAIGANLLCKNAESIYYGMHQAKVILKAPFTAAATGIDYMLSTPYIQSIDRRTATLGMAGYFRDLFEQCYSGMGLILLIVMIGIIVISVVMSIKQFKNNNQFFQWLLIGGLLILPTAMLLVQSVHPYKRVCSFIMVPLSLGIVLIINMGISLINKEKIVAVITYMIVAITGFLVIYRFTTYDYTAPLADRENDIRDVLNIMKAEGVDIKSLDKVYFTDDYQKYVLKFYFDAEPSAATLEEADMVMVSPEMLDESYDSFIWPMLVNYDQSVIDYIEDNYTYCFRDKSGKSDYIIYTR